MKHCVICRTHSIRVILQFHAAFPSVYILFTFEMFMKVIRHHLYIAAIQRGVRQGVPLHWPAD